MKCIVTCAAAMLAVTASGASAQQIPEARIQELIRVAAARAAGGPQIGPTTGTPNPLAPQASRPKMQLTLDDAVKMALDRNLDIAVQRLNPQTFDFSIAGLKSTYLPVIGSTLASQSSVIPATTTTSGAPIGSGITTGLTTYNGAVFENVPWGGGAFAATLNNARSTTTSATALFDPLYNPNWSAQYTQPLIRGLLTDANRQQIAVTRINQDISELQLQATIINTLSNVREAYWDYVYTAQVVDVARQSVALAEQLVRDNQSRVEIGTMAGIDVVTAQSQVAQQRQGLVLADANRRTAELALKQLIVSGTQDTTWNADIDPTDRPEFSPAPVDVASAIRRALGARTDLATARKNVEANKATVKYLKEQARPQADLVARYGLVGLGGTQFVTIGSGISRQVINIIPGGFGNALSSLVRHDFPTWSATLNLSYPLGTNIAGAAVARARLEATQTEAQMHQIELQVATDVTNAAINVQTGIEAVQAAQAAQELAQKTNEFEQAKFEVGISTNYNVILTQRDLNTAKNSYLRAVLNYRHALVELDRLQQTTLQNLNVTIVRTTGLITYAVGSGCPTAGYPCS